MKKIDSPLHSHLETERVEYIQFAFRWMNCLLMRELPMRVRDDAFTFSHPLHPS